MIGTATFLAADDRIVCTQCAELVLRYTDVVTVDGAFARARPGDCLAAVERRRLDVHDRYGHGDVDRRGRCEFFMPLPGAEDQRTGRERYPEFAAEYDAWVAGRNGFRRAAAMRGIERAKQALGHG